MSGTAVIHDGQNWKVYIDRFDMQAAIAMCKAQ